MLAFSITIDDEFHIDGMCNSLVYVTEISGEKFRFFANWRSGDNDDRILQLEQPEIIRNSWQSRIAFA